MKKIFQFLNKPYTTVFLSVVGLTGGFFIGIAGKQIIELENQISVKKNLCKDAFDVMCVQVHACTDMSVKECDEIVINEDLCNRKLPDLQTLYSCKEELRHIQCEDDMPDICSLFME